MGDDTGPEGSRSHEYVLDDYCRRFALDGWRSIRPRQRAIPMLSIAGHRLEAVRVRNAPWQPPELDDFDGAIELDDPGPKMPQAAWHGRIHAALHRQAETERILGHRPVWLAKLRPSGFLSVLRPDAILFKQPRIAVLEVMKAAASSLRRKMVGFGDFDEIMVVVFRGGAVFRPEWPPTATLRRWAAPNKTPPLPVETHD